ncbi:hypothetical protein EDB84DRAFT_1640155 [Lactarius hengduanensis]|nr:hypothetical protein EDB84DRAFT_1640155 [Lactarius hengduanensis]
MPSFALPFDGPSYHTGSLASVQPPVSAQHCIHSSSRTVTRISAQCRPGSRRLPQFRQSAYPLQTGAAKDIQLTYRSSEEVVTFLKQLRQQRNSLRPVTPAGFASYSNLALRFLARGMSSTVDSGEDILLASTVDFPTQYSQYQPDGAGEGVVTPPGTYGNQTAGFPPGQERPNVIAATSSKCSSKTDFTKNFELLKERNETYRKINGSITKDDDQQTVSIQSKGAVGVFTYKPSTKSEARQRRSPRCRFWNVLESESKSESQQEPKQGSDSTRSTDNGGHFYLEYHDGTLVSSSVIASLSEKSRMIWLELDDVGLAPPSFCKMTKIAFDFWRSILAYPNSNSCFFATVANGNYGNEAKPKDTELNDPALIQMDPTSDDDDDESSAGKCPRESSDSDGQGNGDDDSGENNAPHSVIQPCTRVKTLVPEYLLWSIYDPQFSDSGPIILGATGATYTRTLDIDITQPEPNGAPVTNTTSPNNTSADVTSGRAPAATLDGRDLNPATVSTPAPASAPSPTPTPAPIPAPAPSRACSFPAPAPVPACSRPRACSVPAPALVPALLCPRAHRQTEPIQHRWDTQVRRRRHSRGDNINSDDQTDTQGDPTNHGSTVTTTNTGPTGRNLRLERAKADSSKKRKNDTLPAAPTKKHKSLEAPAVPTQANTIRNISMRHWNQLQPGGQGTAAHFDAYYKALTDTEKEPFKKEMYVGRGARRVWILFDTARFKMIDT